MKATRRDFLVTGGASAAILASRLSWAAEAKLPLAFSTLGCPAWDWMKILSFAQANGFQAIELRGLLGSMDLPTCPQFASGQITQSKKEVADHGLKISDLGASSQMHVAEPSERAKQLADARRFIDLASTLEVPYVRVFGNEIKGPREEVLVRVADGLNQLGEYAGPKGVTVLIESHGDFVESPTLKEVLKLAASKHVALLWDAHHTFVGGHEQPEKTVAELGPWIRHTHLKDSVPEGKGRKYVLTGTGDVPVERQVQALRKLQHDGHVGYAGYYCFEWEKMWHPDLQEPEVAFPDYARVMTKYLKEPLAGGMG
jgi:sugar phosphate isomerase/epimerase